MSDILGTKENNWTVKLSDGELFRIPAHLFHADWGFKNSGLLYYENTCQQCGQTREDGNHY